MHAYNLGASAVSFNYCSQNIKHVIGVNQIQQRKVDGNAQGISEKKNTIIIKERTNDKRKTIKSKENAKQRKTFR